MASSYARLPKLLAEAVALPEEERVELARELLRTIRIDEHEAEWSEEITWRAERVLRGESEEQPVDHAGLVAIFFGDGPTPR
jgi:hypothetical protein